MSRLDVHVFSHPVWREVCTCRHRKANHFLLSAKGSEWDLRGGAFGIRGVEVVKRRGLDLVSINECGNDHCNYGCDERIGACDGGRIRAAGTYGHWVRTQREANSG